MFEIKITVEAIGIAQALNNLASAIAEGKANTVPAQATHIPTATAQAPIAPPVTATATAPTVPLQTAPPPQQFAIPIANPNIPLAAAPTFTREQIMTAGATLVDAGRVQELMSLLNSFGVQAVTDLKPEQLGAFATAMREMGAKI
jgi:hypothetical protein